MKNKSIKLNEFNNIAIIQTAFIGDVVLTFPLVQQIKNIHPNSKITFVTTPKSFDLALCVKSIDEVIPYDKRKSGKGYKGIRNIADILKKKEIDCIIAPHRSARTSLITYFAKPRLSIGYNVNAFKFFYKKLVIYYSHKNEINRNLSILNIFDLENNREIKLADVETNIPDSDKLSVEKLLKDRYIQDEDIRIAVAPGSVWKTKRWTDEGFSKLIKLFQERKFKPILVGSNSDIDICNKIESETGSINLAGKTTLPQLLALLQK